MKILGVFLIVVGIACFAVAVTGLFAWMTPVPADASISIEFDEDHTKPTDFLTRNGAAPDTDRWFYDRIGKDDYQLFVTADTWVSYFDAMVYRHAGEFADPWFSTLDSSSSREFGKWRYVQGFSRFHENYFDADDNIYSHYP